MSDRQQWVLRNSVIWHKVKGGPDTTADRLRNVHEPVFHFVKQTSGYYYDADAIRNRPRQAHVSNGAVVSATGVSGVRYRRQIELSTALTDAEKEAAINALEEMLDEVRCGRLSDFRMIIRGQQRTTHSDSELVSGRAIELEQRGFYFLRYHPKGSKPGDAWAIIHEDTQRRRGNSPPDPADLCRIPLLATCPPYETPVAPDFCPFQKDNLCTAREPRPLGCRIYYCDPNYQETGNRITETYLARLKQLAQEHGIPWRYAPLHVYLNENRPDLPS